MTAPAETSIVTRVIAGRRQSPSPPWLALHRNIPSPANLRFLETGDACHESSLGMRWVRVLGMRSRLGARSGGIWRGLRIAPTHDDARSFAGWKGGETKLFRSNRARQENLDKPAPIWHIGHSVIIVYTSASWRCCLLRPLICPPRKTSWETGTGSVYADIQIASLEPTP